MRRWGRVGLLLSVLGWPMLLYGAIFETQHMGVIVGEATAPLTIAVTLGGIFEVPPQEIVSIEGDHFALTDGTVLQGRITAETLAVNTSAGQVIRIPVAELKTMHREKDTPVVPVTRGDIFELHSGEVIVGEARLPLTIRLSPDHHTVWGVTGAECRVQDHPLRAGHKARQRASQRDAGTGHTCRWSAAWPRSP